MGDLGIEEGASEKVRRKFELRATIWSQTCVMSFMTVEPTGCRSRQFPPRRPLALFPLEAESTKGNQSMIKSIDALAEIIRNPKHAFRKADDRPVKAQKHRYERRKIKEFIKQWDLAEENPS